MNIKNKTSKELEEQKNNFLDKIKIMETDQELIALFDVNSEKYTHKKEILYSIREKVRESGDPDFSSEVLKSFDAFLKNVGNQLWKAYKILLNFERDKRFNILFSKKEDRVKIERIMFYGGNIDTTYIMIKYLMKKEGNICDILDNKWIWINWNIENIQYLEKKWYVWEWKDYFEGLKKFEYFLTMKEENCSFFLDTFSKEVLLEIAENRDFEEYFWNNEKTKKFKDKVQYFKEKWYIQEWKNTYGEIKQFEYFLIMKEEDFSFFLDTFSKEELLEIAGKKDFEEYFWNNEKAKKFKDKVLLFKKIDFSLNDIKQNIKIEYDILSVLVKYKVDSTYVVQQLLNLDGEKVSFLDYLLEKFWKKRINDIIPMCNYNEVNVRSVIRYLEKKQVDYVKNFDQILRYVTVLKEAKPWVLKFYIILAEEENTPLEELVLKSISQDSSTKDQLFDVLNGTINPVLEKWDIKTLEMLKQEYGNDIKLFSTIGLVNHKTISYLINDWGFSGKDFLEERENEISSIDIKTLEEVKKITIQEKWEKYFEENKLLLLNTLWEVNYKNLMLIQQYTTIKIDKILELSDILRKAETENLKFILEYGITDILSLKIPEMSYILKVSNPENLKLFTNLLWTVFKWNDLIEQISHFCTIWYISNSRINKDFTVYDTREENIKEIKRLFLKDVHSVISQNWEEFTKTLDYSPKEQRDLFVQCILKDVDQKKMQESNFPITKENFLDTMEDDDVLLEIPQDKWIKVIPRPRTKKWFLEDPKRKEYITKYTLVTVMKFGTNVALLLIEWSKDPKIFKKYYNNAFDYITRDNERNRILQLWEIFSLVLNKKEYSFFDELVDHEFPFWAILKSFIEKYSISDKGKTVMILMFASEINKRHACWLDMNIKELCKNVYERVKKYEKVLRRYDRIPEEARTSIGLEYEVTESIWAEKYTDSKWNQKTGAYTQRTNSNYKKDIEILSDYSWIAKGYDAIHEIATKPTDNVYLLILEMKLLQELDFIDLNFEHGDYERASRSYHLTLWWKYGIRLDETANLMQNILIMANLWWINAGKNVKQINKFGNIKDKDYDCEPVFWNYTPTTEFRSLAIDKAESFERALVSAFNMGIGKQLYDKYVKESSSELYELYDMSDILEINAMLNEFDIDKKNKDIILAFVRLKLEVYNAVKDHNKNFYSQETSWYLEDWVYKDEFLQKRNNKKMFADIVKNDTKKEKILVSEYIQEKSFIHPISVWSRVNINFVNTLTFINNLYLKPPQGDVSAVNATAVLETTRTQNEYRSYEETDKDALRKTIFDHIDSGTIPREWRYFIQGSSDRMIINQVSQALIDYNKTIERILKN